MICLRCDSEDFAETPDAVIEQEFRGEVLKVQSPVWMCSMCGWQSLDTKQADELRRRTANAYRKKHGLLTSDALRSIRKMLNMNQVGFADFLDVGEASVKRWETWLVQEKSSDELIRLKCREVFGPIDMDAFEREDDKTISCPSAIGQCE